MTQAVNRARAIAVIRREDIHRGYLVPSGLRGLIRDWGIENVLTDDALHALALRIIKERRQHNKDAAASRAHYAAQQEKNRAV